MMSSVMAVLQLIGWILLALLVIALILLLLVLLVPIRYEGQFDVQDPAPHEEAAWGALRDQASVRASCSWFGPLLRASVTWSGELTADLRIAWVHKDLLSLVSKDKGQEPRKAQDQADKAPQAGIYDKIVGVYRKADYYRRVLGKEETQYTIGRLRDILLQTLRRVLPQRWQITGTVGLGDPAATAKVLEVQGILYPVIAGHVSIAPEFEQYQMDVRGALQGRIRLVHLITALLFVAIDGKSRQTIRRFKHADQAIAAHYSKAAS